MPGAEKPPLIIDGKEYFTLATYARNAKIAYNTAKKYVNTGRLSESVREHNGKIWICPEIAADEIAGKKPEHGNRDRITLPVDRYNPADYPPIVQSNEIRAYWSAIREENNAKREAGLLIEMEAAKRVVVELTKMLTDGLNTIPERIGERLAAQTEAVECAALVRTEIEAVLSSLDIHAMSKAK